MENKSILDIIIAHLSQPFGKNFFETSASILATAIVLFFTLVLIPIQQFVNRYSPSLLSYFKKDRFVILLMTVLLGSFLYQVAMWFFTPIYLTAYISAFLLAFSFILIIIMIFRVIKMMNPAEYLFPKINEDCKEVIRTEIKPEELQNPIDQIARLEDQMDQVLVAGEKIDPNEKKWNVSGGVVNRIIEKMLPLKSIIMNLIITADYELFASAIQIFKNISISYFVARKEFKSTRDPFQIYLCETLTDLVKTAEGSSNVYYTRSLFTIIKEITLATLQVEVIGSQNGYNHLATPLAGILKERVLIGVVKKDMDRAFDATGNYGDIGCALAYKGFGHSAAEIAEGLKEIAVYCNVLKDNITLVPVRRSLATIFFNLLRYRKLYGNYDHPYRTMMKIYETMAEIPTDAGTALGIGDPLFAYEADLFKDKSLSTLVMMCLFASTDENTVYHNLDVAEDIIIFMEKHHDQDHVMGKMLTEMLYQSGLWLLAFGDKEIVLEMTLSQEATVPSEKNLRRANKILFNLAQYMVMAFFDSLERKKKHFFPHDIQSPSLSLIYLLIHLNAKHNLGLTKEISELLLVVVSRLSNLQKKIDENEHASFLVFASYLKRIGQISVADEIKNYAEKLREGRDRSVDPMYFVNYIKRPINTFDASLFGQLDREIFGKDEM
jgi:hypothetical protein